MDERSLLKEDYKLILEFQDSLQNSEEDFSKRVLDKLYGMFGLTCLYFSLADEEGRFFRPEGINFSKQALKDYVEYFFEKDPIYHKNLPHPALYNRDTVLMTELLDYSTFERTEYYNDFFKKCDFYHEIGIYLKCGGKHIGAMGVMRPKSEGNFTKREHALVNTITTIISHELKYFLDKNKMKSKTLLYKSSFLNNPIGVIILDNNFQVVEFNQSAAEYCREISGDKQSSRHPIDTVIGNILNNIGLGIKNGNTCIYTDYTGYRFEIIPTLVPDIRYKLSTNYVVYIKNGSSSNSGALNNGSVAAGKLTNRELSIVDLIAKGLTNKQIGERLFISPQTVRTHIENIMQKLQVNNRTAILYKLGKVK